MGSFNKIGFISRIPINPRDPTVLIFIHPNKNQESKLGGSIYADDIFRPVLLPIFGEYDDYGKIEAIERDLNIQLIEEFFGIPIETIIEEIDDNMVGRGSSNLSATKNKELYSNLSFCLEHKKIYDMMASKNRTSWTNSEIGRFWLTKLGWEFAGDSGDSRFKYLWKHPQIPDYVIHCDGNWSQLYKGGKEVRKVKGIPDYYGIYKPYQLYNFMLSLGIDPKITNQAKEWCMVDLSYTISAEYAQNNKKEKDDGTDGIRNKIYQKILRGRELSRWPEGIYSIKELMPQNQHRLTKIVLDIVSGDYPLLNQSNKTILIGMKNPITNYIRFNSYLGSINGLYFPSSYGNQDSAIEYHFKINEVTKEILAEKSIREKEDAEILRETSFLIPEPIDNIDDVIGLGNIKDGEIYTKEVIEKLEKEEDNFKKQLEEFSKKGSKRLAEKNKEAWVIQPAVEIEATTEYDPKYYAILVKDLTALNKENTTVDQVDQYLSERDGYYKGAPKKDINELINLISKIPIIKKTTNVTWKDGKIEFRGKTKEDTVF